MTIPRLNAMTKYWTDNPPVQVMIAAYFGIGKKKDKAAERDDEGNSLFDLLPRG